MHQKWAKNRLKEKLIEAGLPGSKIAQIQETSRKDAPPDRQLSCCAGTETTLVQGLHKLNLFVALRSIAPQA